MCWEEPPSQRLYLDLSCHPVRGHQLPQGGGKLPAAVPVLLLDPCHFLRGVETLTLFCWPEVGRNGAGKGTTISSSELQWLISRLLKGQTFVLMIVNALSSESHTLPFLTFPISQ